MDVRITVVPGLPRLAWLARIGADGVSVFVGPWVTFGETWWAEGPWNGPLAEGGFADASFFAGSGGRVAGGKVVLATPSHTMEHLYSVAVGDHLWISNSLVALYERAGTEPDPSYPDYVFDIINSLRLGIQLQPLMLPGGLGIHTAANFTVGPDLSTEHVRRPVTTAPHTFAELRSLLVSTMSDVLENAADRSRPRPFRPITTLSRGYDSVAVAALASDLGCREAVLSLDPRQPEDDGTPVGELLGMSVTSYPREIPPELDPKAVAEFMVCPAGIELPRAIMADQLEGALLLIGNQGDSIFGVGGGLLPEYRHPGATAGSGASMAEFRLRVGMQLFPVAAIAALHRRELLAISRSGDMEPWSIGGDYDRPIARRLAEEAGVPRALFGQEKLATSHWWVHRAGLPRRAEASFREWFRNNVEHPPDRGGVPGMLARVVLRRWCAWVEAGRPGLPDALERPLIPLLLEGWRRPHKMYGTDYLFTFHWGVDTIRDRYRLPEMVGR